MSNILSTVISPAAFWKPEWTVRSAWLGHAPFAFWLIEEHRPDVLFELGTHLGFSYFAFCQAVEKLRLPTRCCAVDTWLGDAHAGFYGDEVFKKVSDHNQKEYADFSRLSRLSFADAAGGVADGTIDLLHIDGRHRYEDVRQDFELWQPKLSSRALVLFHDTQVKRDDFGVFKFWNEIKQDRPHFEFTHGFGLGVLAVGSNLSEPVKALFAATSNEKDTHIIRSVYERLGGGIADGWDLFETRHTLAKLKNQPGNTN